MHNYTFEDFVRYYGKAFFLHPTKNIVVQVVGAGRDGGSVKLSDNSEVMLRDLDWKHVQTPRLGYRHIKDGAELYYVTRHAGRRAEKGVVPAAIIINEPSTIAAVRKQLGINADIALTKDFAEHIFAPKFISLNEAVANIAAKTECIGYALSYDWAVTLGVYKTAPFILHFKGQRVAGSENGQTWKWYDKDAEALFKRSML